jgi:hypothetical protein
LTIPIHNLKNEMGLHTFTAVTMDGTQDFQQSKRMYYYEGSILPIEWTNQHGCGGNSKISCEIVLQYACEDTLDPRCDFLTIELSRFQSIFQSGQLLALGAKQG